MKRYRISIVAVLFLCVAAPIGAQKPAPESGAQPEGAAQRAGEIARTLAGQGQFVALPSAGRVKQSVNKEAQSFALPTGESRVALFKLPDYSAPYTLTITSPCNHGCVGFSKSIFVPSGMFFDAEFQPTRSLPTTEFELLEPGLSKSLRLEAKVSIEEPRKSDRYLLLYTTDEDVRRVVQTRRIRGATGAPVLFGKKNVKVKGSAAGSLELEARAASSGSSISASPKEPPSAEHSNWSFSPGKGPGEANFVMFRQFSAPNEELGLLFTCAKSDKRWKAILVGRDHVYLMQMGIWYRFDEPETTEAFHSLAQVRMPEKSEPMAILDEDMIKKMLTHRKVCLSVPAWADESTANRKPACPGGAVELEITGSGASKGKTGVYIDGEFSLEGLQETMFACHCGERHLEKMLGKKK
jgi:hypothetical protein